LERSKGEAGRGAKPRRALGVDLYCSEKKERVPATTEKVEGQKNQGEELKKNKGNSQLDNGGLGRRGKKGKKQWLRVIRNWQYLP